MPSLDLLFAWAIAILAGVAVIGALTVVLVKEFFAIRETIRRHRTPDPYEDFWHRQRALTEPKTR